MERIVVTLGERSYPITIASGLFNEPASFLPLKSGEQVMLVTNETPLLCISIRSAAYLNRRVLTSIALSSLTASSIKAWQYSTPSLQRCCKSRMDAILHWLHLAAAWWAILPVSRRRAISAAFASFKSQRRYCRRLTPPLAAKPR